MKNKKKVSFFLVRLLLLLLFFLSILTIGSLKIKEKHLEEGQEKQTVAKAQSQEEEMKQKVAFLPLKQEIAITYAKYPVVAQLTIPKIKVDTPVLSKFSEDAMKKCVTKLAGGNPNEIGNFCIIGHNYIRKNMFSKLKNLETGDVIYLSDRVYGTLKYIVESISIVKPEDVSCLKNQNQFYELTLITCTADSNSRIIVKAKAEAIER